MSPSSLPSCRREFAFAFSLVVGVLAGPAHARTWHVLADGTSDAPTIQAGIDSAAVLDTVLVGPGIYQENIDYRGKDVVILSEAGPQMTTIDGSSRDDSVVKLHNAETRAASLEGFTITGGNGTNDFGSQEGGGILCLNASPIIRNNCIVSNHSLLDYGVGGGMAVGSGLIASPKANPLIEENIFAMNAASNGGALSINNARATVRKNVFRENSCTADGGAIWGLFDEGGAEIIGNEFWNNTAGDHGGGIHMGNAGVADGISIETNLFVHNQAIGTGLEDTGYGSAIYVQGMPGHITNNTMVRNQGLGGAVELKNVMANLEVRRNIIALNYGGGISCRLTTDSDVGPNLLWQNTPVDIDSACPANWVLAQILKDPLFCGAAVDNYTVADNSPAVVGEEVMGAFSEPGCGPVVVEHTTWGRLKVLYVR